ncbi:VWA domain-containing protein [Saccharopolyspora rhizosphaerae]|uniref:VWA domain-containing protein n=1 Tax=Saccharopolyspora rhizosphaerae TaxID=2492662 RepID=A0A3R8R780_9PSEU|nr:VWA domain-containing protein [Saccharopolyspora rhizosphaerae]RRO19994.1 VWA domain-containing protein [Saccharopolyspora rhizosphaerae]
MTLQSRLVGFTGALREQGVRVGPGETVDAAAVVDVLGMADRERLREGLAAALLRADGQRKVFDAAFDLYFPAGVGAPESARGEADPGLDQRLVDALAADDSGALSQLAGEAVDSLGHFGGENGPQGWSAHQTLERLQPQTLLARVLAAMRGDAEEDFTDRLDRDEIRRRIDDFRDRVRTEARRRSAELRGVDHVAKHAIAPSADQVDFLSAGRDQLAELRRAVQPLARKLATRMAARRRRASRGSIDLRRTLRRSLSTGGVPLRPAYAHHRPARPEIVLLCDVSGSVAGFANFTMLLVQALHDQFSKVRVFAFVNRTDEVTHLVEPGAADPAELGRRILTEATVTGWHDSSDYGSALAEFTDRYLEALGPRTSVLVLGDARTNGWDPDLEALHAIKERSRRVFWLNPEPEVRWSTGDSAAHAYAGVVEMHECRNTRRLAHLVSTLLPV